MAIFTSQAGPPRVILGCIDIGSNTTRLLVAEAGGGELRALCNERAYTCIRKSLDATGCIPREKIAETVAVVRDQAAAARELGAEEVIAVATAAIREAPNGADLERAVEEVASLPLRVISGEEEARLSFAGATRTLPAAAKGTTAVVDVGGGSTEIAVGSTAGGVEWWKSLRIGSAMLAGEHLHTDPPTPDELAAARDEATAAFAGIGAPPVDVAVAVGGTATSLLCVVGAALDHDALERGIELVSEARIADVAARLELEEERVRLLPAGILVLQAASDCLGPLEVARGGLREGVILDRAAAVED
jgi:exopolyphosphatase/guanosine-5'-triphosphate,3'-diphosphate pyrophosphatase